MAIPILEEVDDPPMYLYSGPYGLYWMVFGVSSRVLTSVDELIVLMQSRRLCLASRSCHTAAVPHG